MVTVKIKYCSLKPLEQEIELKGEGTLENSINLDADGARRFFKKRFAESLRQKDRDILKTMRLKL